MIEYINNVVEQRSSTLDTDIKFTLDNTGVLQCHG